VRQKFGDPHAAFAVLLNLNIDGAMGKRFWPLVIVVSRCPMRIDSGRSLSNHSFITGLWSYRSTCGGPPTMWK